MSHARSVTIWGGYVSDLVEETQRVISSVNEPQSRSSRGKKNNHFLFFHSSFTLLLLFFSFLCVWMLFQPCHILPGRSKSKSRKKIKRKSGSKNQKTRNSDQSPREGREIDGVSTQSQDIDQVSVISSFLFLMQFLNSKIYYLNRRYL